MNRIYMDCNASTPIAPDVAEAIQPFLTEHYGNPASQHWASAPAKRAVERARSQVARLLSCSAEEVVFTSGGTESNNHAIVGAYLAHHHRGNHIITTQIEHPAVTEPCRFLERMGATVSYIPVDTAARVDPDAVRAAITGETILITVMHANNEVGTIQDVAEIARLAHSQGVLFHTDAAQSVGKIPTGLPGLGADLLSLAGHKLYAPKGVGALYIRRGVEIEPLVRGAGHESGRRAGTENVLLDVGLGAACELAESWIGMPHVRDLRDLFWEMLCERFGDRVILNGHPTERLPNTVNVSFVGIPGAEVLSRLPEVAASTGSACHEGSVELSPVLKAMGVPSREGMGAIRFSLGRTSTQSEIEYVVQRLASIVQMS